MEYGLNLENAVIDMMKRLCEQDDTVQLLLDRIEDLAMKADCGYLANTSRDEILDRAINYRKKLLSSSSFEYVSKAAFNEGSLDNYLVNIAIVALMREYIYLSFIVGVPSIQFDGDDCAIMANDTTAQFYFYTEPSKSLQWHGSVEIEPQGFISSLVSMQTVLAENIIDSYNFTFKFILGLTGSVAGSKERTAYLQLSQINKSAIENMFEDMRKTNF